MADSRGTERHVKAGAHPLAVSIPRNAQGGVVDQFLDGVGQLAAHACLGALVCLVARVTGIHLHWDEAQLPAPNSALKQNSI